MGSKINNDVPAIEKHVDKTSDITAYKHFSDTELMFKKFTMIHNNILLNVTAVVEGVTYLQYFVPHSE